MRKKATQEIGIYRMSLRAIQESQARLFRTLDKIAQTSYPGQSVASMELARAYDALTTAAHNLEMNIQRVESFEEYVERTAAEVSS